MCEIFVGYGTVCCAMLWPKRYQTSVTCQVAHFISPESRGPSYFNIQMIESSEWYTRHYMRQFFASGPRQSSIRRLLRSALAPCYMHMPSGGFEVFLLNCRWVLESGSTKVNEGRREKRGGRGF